ncbi:Asp-tRNA(Asn)/Glu-tRNA(Gln) amidotransferase subunit GatA [Telmatospirillum sp.]|uniref:Asp-tRNA(Asn)/Glu-tRNA(Gln) amidotransferase subunit GatA n=1 Tax=Telmatospirillum sp. TaxID=2079197 RepID=UPI00284A9D6E|nr:Asp-tRNA(Asn)/Glu-tRNA(Gln) amidotransferase subunit GatA [Telmatospirillum sp.]MDR3441338.1 Asp-tRNA(Asn)/Glu-tRNA(Gln) amidotransferase subunit GatA [Telmatospirillum sp.]
MSELTKLTMAEAREGLKAKRFTAVELTKAHLAAVGAARGLNAFVTETPDLALERAKLSDAKLAKGEAGPLEGLPIGMKDLFCTEGVRSTACSRILENFVPTYESTVSGKLKDAGAVVLGKTALDEFAMGSSNETSAFGPVTNPWKRKSDPSVKLVPGGSSGGSAAAVSARLVMGATGTDTGGSIRQPASFCGLVGLKPTYGRCSRWGIVAFASSLDQAGPMTRTVRDAAIMLGSMVGYDPKDSTSANVAVPNFEAALTGDIRGMKVGIPKEYRPDGLSAEISKLWADGIGMLKDAGATPVEISLPHTKYALPTYYIVAPAECSSNLARYDGVRYGKRVEGKTLDEMYAKSRAAGFGKEVRRRILIGTYVLSAGYYDAYYIKAQKVRRLIADDFAKAFETVDVILTPTAPSAAFGQGETDDNPITMWLNDIFTIPTSLAGLPGLSVPTGLSADGLPLGLQLIGRPFDEETVLKVAEVMERAAGFTAVPAGI